MTYCVGFFGAGPVTQAIHLSDLLADGWHGDTLLKG